LPRVERAGDRRGQSVRARLRADHGGLALRSVAQKGGLDMTRRIVFAMTGLVAVAFSFGVAAAHITPPVVLVSDRDAVASLLSGARRFFVREIRLSAEERAAIQKRSGWRPEEDFYRFYLGRDDQGRLVAATVFVTDFTIHGPVRVAVALGPDGKV